MNLNQLYLTALASNSNVVAVEVYFKDNEAVSSRTAPCAAPQPSQAYTAPAAPWQIDHTAGHISEQDFKRRPVAPTAKAKPSRSVFTYLAPKSYDLKEDDAVIVVNDTTGKVTVAHVHAVTMIDLDKLNTVAESYGYQHADGHFWKWIVAPVVFDKYNDLNKARETFLAKAASVEQNKRAAEMRQQLVELYGSASSVDDLFDTVLPGADVEAE